MAVDVINVHRLPESRAIVPTGNRSLSADDQYGVRVINLAAWSHDWSSGVAAGWYDRAEFVRNPIRTVWPRLLVKTGREVDDRFYAEDALIVAAHADDETLGCGATIAQKTALGGRLWVVVATDGSRSPAQVDDIPTLVERRRAELFRAVSHLNVPPGNIFALDLPDGALGSATQDLADQVAELVIQERPTQVFTHSRWDPHPDHRSCWEAVMQALSMVRTRVPGFRNVVYEFPIWDWSLGPWPPRDGARLSKAVHLLADPAASLSRGRPWLSGTGGFLSIKRAALMEYQSQVAPVFGQPPSLTKEFIDGLCGPYEVFLPGKLPRRQRAGTDAGDM